MTTSRKPSEPWRVVLSGGSASSNIAHSNETNHTSQTKAYDFLREALRQGSAETARVLQWDDGRWWHYETLHAEDLYDFEVPPRPTTDEEFAALPILNLNDFHQEQP